MKLGITQLAQLTVQALDHRAKTLCGKVLDQHDEAARGEALYQQVHAEAEKSHAALRLLLREVIDAADHAARRGDRAAVSRENDEKAYAIRQAQAAIDRVVSKYQPQRIAA